MHTEVGVDADGRLVIGPTGDMGMATTPDLGAVIVRETARVRHRS